MGAPIAVYHDHADVLDWPWDQFETYGGGYARYWACRYCGDVSRAMPTHRYVVSSRYPAPFCECGRDVDDMCHRLMQGMD